MAPPPEPHSGKHHAYICPVTTRGCSQTTVFLSLLIISCIHRSVKRNFKLLTSIINSLSLLLSLSLSPPSLFLVCTCSMTVQEEQPVGG